MSIFPDMETKKKKGIKNSNRVSAWTCLLCVGRVFVFSKYCHIKTFFTGLEWKRFWPAELSNLTYFGWI